MTEMEKGTTTRKRRRQQRPAPKSPKARQRGSTDQVIEKDHGHQRAAMPLADTGFAGKTVHERITSTSTGDDSGWGATG